MITREKLRIYKKYSGDSGAWIRFGKKTEFDSMDGEDWAIIDEFLQNLEMIQKGLVSEQFKAQILDKFNATFDHEETRSELIKMIEKY